MSMCNGFLGQPSVDKARTWALQRRQGFQKFLHLVYLPVRSLGWVWSLQVAEAALPSLRCSCGAPSCTRSLGQEKLCMSSFPPATTPSCVHLDSALAKEVMLPLTPPPKSSGSSGGVFSSKGEKKIARMSSWVLLSQGARKEKRQARGKARGKGAAQTHMWTPTFPLLDSIQTESCAQRRQRGCSE